MANRPKDYPVDPDDDDQSAALTGFLIVGGFLAFLLLTMRKIPPKVPSAGG